MSVFIIDNLKNAENILLAMEFVLSGAETTRTKKLAIHMNSFLSKKTEDYKEVLYNIISAKTPLKEGIEHIDSLSELSRCLRNLSEDLVKLIRDSGQIDGIYIKQTSININEIISDLSHYEDKAS